MAICTSSRKTNVFVLFLCFLSFFFCTCAFLAWRELPGFLLLHPEARHQERQGAGLRGVPAQRGRSQQGKPAHRVGPRHLRCCAVPPLTPLRLSHVLQDKEESAIGRLFKRVWSIQPSFRHVGVLCGGWGRGFSLIGLGWCWEGGGQNDRSRFFPSLLPCWSSAHRVCSLLLPCSDCNTVCRINWTEQNWL